MIMYYMSVQLPSKSIRFTQTLNNAGFYFEALLEALLRNARMLAEQRCLQENFRNAEDKAE